jgi:hypothetical protein
MDRLASHAGRLSTVQSREAKNETPSSPSNMTVAAGGVSAMCYG